MIILDPQATPGLLFPLAPLASVLSLLLLLLPLLHRLPSLPIASTTMATAMETTMMVMYTPPKSQYSIVTMMAMAMAMVMVIVTALVLVLVPVIVMVMTSSSCVPGLISTDPASSCTLLHG
jgi:hypothetical protein